MMQRAMSGTRDHEDGYEPLRTSALFLLGAVAILFIGASRTFVAQLLSVQLPSESSQGAMLRLQYALLGPTMFAAWAVCYRWFEQHHEPQQRERGRIAFWLMFAGFNVAFLPTSWRGPRPPLITDPGALISGAGGLLPIVGLVALISGWLIGVWSLSRNREHPREQI